jgi:subtilisin family serine protease
MRKHLFALCLAVLAALWPETAYANGDPSAPAAREILVMVRIPPSHYHPSGDYGGYGDQVSQGARVRMARRIARQYGLKLEDNWPMPMIGVDCFVMIVPDARSTSGAAEQVAHDADVAWAQPMELFTARGATASHNDPLYAAEPAAGEWHLADLHKIATGRGAKVAVIDSGIEARHPDLDGQVVVNRNFVAGRSPAVEQHGTSVAGIIAARADNGIGIAGVAPGARLLGLRACWQTPAATVCDTLSLAKAIYYAVDQHADVINLSLSGPEDRLLRGLLKLALTHGSAIVTAFDDKLVDGGFPASMPGVIAVSDASLAPSRGDVYTAPGRDVPTTMPGGRWSLVNGSSYAAAHVSGLLALMRERRRLASLVLVSQRRGGGTIDACATLVRVAGACDCSCGPARFASGGRQAR